MKQKCGMRNTECGIKRKIIFLLVFLLFSADCSLFTVNAFADEDMIKLIQKKEKELKERDEALKKEEERLSALRKDIDERLLKYTDILNQVENEVKKLEQVRDEKFDQVVKTYETMPAEDAAARLSALDMATAVRLILKMKSKKAAAILALIETKSAAAITEAMLATGKKFPAR